jgi:CMP-N,N'-diacetyllegionaminic acid synthase
MLNGKTFLAIIPARGSSKGLPGKNIKELCGKPLIVWTIEAGLNSQYIDELVVSTDDEKIANIARKNGAKVPFIRPDYLSTDIANSVDVVNHVIDYYKKEFSRKFSYIILLEPTSPLRDKKDIDNMIECILKKEDKYDSITSVGEVHEHPSIMKKIIKESSLERYCQELEMTARRQENEVAYFPYGVAYIVKVNSFIKESTFYTTRNTFFKIKRYQCYEIDDIYDFLAIENIMKYEWYSL